MSVALEYDCPPIHSDHVFCSLGWLRMRVSNLNSKSIHSLRLWFYISYGMTIHKDFSSFFGAPVKNNLSNFFGVPIQPVSTPAISILTSPSSSLSHFERKLEQRFVNKKSNPELRKTSNQSKKWRGKTHEKKLKERYRDPSYVFNLLHTSHLQVYDSGGRPICHGNCKFNCQAKFENEMNLLLG